MANSCVCLLLRNFEFCLVENFIQSFSLTSEFTRYTVLFCFGAPLVCVAKRKHQLQILSIFTFRPFSPCLIYIPYNKIHGNFLPQLISNIFKSYTHRERGSRNHNQHLNIRKNLFAFTYICKSSVVLFFFFNWKIYMVHCCAWVFALRLLLHLAQRLFFSIEIQISIANYTCVCGRIKSKGEIQCNAQQRRRKKSKIILHIMCE